MYFEIVPLLNLKAMSDYVLTDTSYLYLIMERESMSIPFPIRLWRKSAFCCWLEYISCFLVDALSTAVIMSCGDNSPR